MAKTVRNFLAGKMNKVADQRVLPEGEYVDAMNIRMGSTENTEQGAIENIRGNLPLTKLSYIEGTQLSPDATCIGSYADSRRNTIYWFVHDPDFDAVGATGKLDLIVSYNVLTNILTYIVVSIDDGGGVNTTLNFNPSYLITGVDMVGDLLFFTDDYNAPRCLNINTRYDIPVVNVDWSYLGEALMVLKRPPMTPPEVTLQLVSNDSNFLTERFISFAYRYEYADGQYSATSQWTQIAFEADNFNFSVNSFLNEGMTNRYNAATILYNTGSPLVVGIDILFKESGKNLIHVIEKIDKEALSIPDFNDFTYQFVNSKIFTILPESEILRLYDNVPRFAKAQTIMGNRLMYGNYIEGYDLVDKNGSPIKNEFQTELIVNEIGEEALATTFSNGNYTIDAANPITITNSVLNIDFTGIDLVEGSNISIDITIIHNDFTGDTPDPTETTASTQFAFDFRLMSSYATPYQLANSVEFINAIGTAINIAPIATSCSGTTLTDIINCGLPATLTATPSSVQKVNSGITAIDEPMLIISSSPTSQIIGLQLVAMKYVDDPTTPKFTTFEYYNYTFASVVFQKIASPISLHSNRDYEVGIVYMDDFGRSSTAIVSPFNTEHVPCGNCSTQNLIRVTIPYTNLAPYWATKYKFVMKADRDTYETIYTSLFFKSPTSSDVYFLLEGENMRKVEAGDRYIVKSDSNGPLQNCAYATVLEKEAKEEGFIDPEGDIAPPSGVYMKMNPNDFATVYDEYAIIAPGEIRGDTNFRAYPLVAYPMNVPDPANPGDYIDYTVPALSRIKMSFYFERLGSGDGNNNCERRIYTLETTLVSSQDYANMFDWWIGDDVQSVLNSGTQTVGAGGCSIGNIFYPTLSAVNPPINGDYCNNLYQFYRDPTTNRLALFVTGTAACGSSRKRRATMKVNIEVYRAENTFIFETEPIDTLPDVFYENGLVFDIDADGFHEGNVQNQDASTDAIIDIGFFNCFAFGNGAESYKVRDSIIGRSFGLGERVTTVAEQDYQEVDRYADITYSGIYNQESNINKLNEFNLGLINYKSLETSFGNIYILDGRQTDVLVLQEDKISYVLAGKNLLSDAAGGNAITSVPEVLGTQIARSEDYGISFNPESYVQWGYDRFFTDVKRGAVIQLRGDSYQSDQLKVISEPNMRTYFRDAFVVSFNNQKLGAYDPYSNEYILSINDRDLPYNPDCLPCGISQTFTLSSEIDGVPQEMNFCVDLGGYIGPGSVVCTVVSIAEDSFYDVEMNYNGVITGTPAESTTSQTFYYDKTNPDIETADISITYKNNVVVTIIINCLTAVYKELIQLVLTDNEDAGETIHTEFRYNYLGAYSPTTSELLTFLSTPDSPTVSRYSITGGFVGGLIPIAGSTVNIATNKIGTDNFSFDYAKNKFFWYESDDLYDEATLIANLSTFNNATPIVPSVPGATRYSADFTPDISFRYLYYIWDLRSAYAVDLCYGEPGTLPKQVGCDCAACEECCTISFTNMSSTQPATVIFPLGVKCNPGGDPYYTLTPMETWSPGTIYVQDWYVSEGNVSAIISDCGEICNCSTYVLDNNYTDTEVVYTECGGDTITTTIVAGDSPDFCAQDGSFVSVGSFSKNDDCGCCPPGNTCRTYKVVVPADEPGGNIEYTDCNNEPVTKYVFPSETFYFCSIVGENPTIPYSKYEVTVIAPCGCFI